MLVNHTICDAIAEGRLLRFRYSALVRIVEPYSHGFNLKRREVLRGFQIRGGSQSGEEIGWKFFLVERMTDVAVLSSSFRNARPGSAEAANELIIIHCQMAD